MARWLDVPQPEIWRFDEERGRPNVKKSPWKIIVLATACLATIACERDPVLLRVSSRTRIDPAPPCGPNAFQVAGTPTAPVCACLPGFVGNGFVCTPEISCDSDMDTETASFTITHLGLPVADGFNLDGLNNAFAPAGAGQNVAGCGKVDIAGGIDNALLSVTTSLLAVTNTADSLQASLAQTVPDGGTTGPVTLFVVLSRLAIGQAPNDSCVDADLVVSMPGRPIRSVHGVGSLGNNVLSVSFEAEVVLPFVPNVLPDNCTDSACTPALLELPLRNARARLALDFSHTRILPGSIVGGSMFVDDCTGSTSTGCTDGIYAAANASGLRAVLTSWGLAANLAPTTQTMFVQAFDGARDLHMNFDGTLAPCTGANTSVTDKNSVSVAFTLDSD